MDDLTIPSVKKYKQKIEAQLKQVKNLEQFTSIQESITIKQIDSDQIKRLIDFKHAELNYVSCYLTILNSLESICKTCQTSEDCSYDYEKEDEILNEIEDKMKELRQLENTLSLKKTYYESDGNLCSKAENLTDEQKKSFLINFEDSLFEKVESLQI